MILYDQHVYRDDMNPPQPDLSVGDVTVSPGKSGVVTIIANDVGGLKFRAQPGMRMVSSKRPKAEVPQLVLDEVEFSTSPSEILQSHPPIWIWSEVLPEVIVEVSVAVAQDTPTGRFEFAIGAWIDFYDDGEEAVTKEFVILVEE